MRQLKRTFGSKDGDDSHFGNFRSFLAAPTSRLARLPSLTRFSWLSWRFSPLA